MTEHRGRLRDRSTSTQEITATGTIPFSVYNVPLWVDGAWRPIHMEWTMPLPYDRAVLQRSPGMPSA